MRRLLLTLVYDGAGFRGWQVQDRGLRSVQGAVEEAIEKVTQETVRVTGAGRTDAGVHARGQCAHFDSRSRLTPIELRSALNGVLPDDVAVSRAIEVPVRFHARSDALGKTYCYRILERASPCPLRRGQTWHRRSRLDLDAMRAAAAPLLGEHDFAAFRGAPGGAPEGQSTVRRLDRLELVRRDDEVRVWAEGPSFLRYMVRNLVGTLVEVGQGRRAPEQPARALAGRERADAGPTAPARGLCLERVRYAAEAENARLSGA